MTFTESLKTGLLGESHIAQWLIRRGYSVLPAYEVEVNHGKGPRLFTANGQLISPDLLVFNAGKTMWCEAKTKSAFTWHRISKTWQTGVDRRHWKHYVEVAKVTPFPVWLLFLHKPNLVAKDTPEGMVCPSGLFGNSVPHLLRHVHHEHENHGPSGMVYWSAAALKKIAEYDEVLGRTEPF